MEFAMVCNERRRRARRQLLQAAIIVHGMACTSIAFAQEARIESKPSVVVRVAEAIVPMPSASGAINDRSGAKPSSPVVMKIDSNVEVKADLTSKSNTSSGRAPQLYKKSGSHISVASNPTSSLSISDATPVAVPVDRPMALPPAVPKAAPVASHIASPAAPQLAVPADRPMALPPAAPVASHIAAPPTLQLAVPAAQPMPVPVASPMTSLVASPIAAPVASQVVVPVAQPIVAPAQPPEIQVVEAPNFLPIQSEEVLLIPQAPLPVTPVSARTERKQVPALPNIVHQSKDETSLASVRNSRVSDIPLSDRITIYQRRMTSSTFDKKVVKAVSFDESTCKSFIVDSNNIALLGVKTGQARIEVIFDDGSSSMKLVSVESPVYRGEPVNQNEKIASLTQSLADMYPNASIELSVISGGAIAVRGEVRNEIDARDIMVLVRQMFLVPIQDKLIVRNR